MIHVIADNITSPLGLTSSENLRRIYAGDSELHRYEGKWGLPDSFVASLFSDTQWEKIRIEGLTRFESLVARSITEALTHTQEDVLTGRTCLIISTTKANVELIDRAEPQALSPAEAVKNIARKLGIETEPIVVCNACISGVAAQVLAKRLLDCGSYDYAIVSGCDVQSKFIVSGFQSLKSTSSEECRPFDMERTGLNLGEAAATLVFSRKEGTSPTAPWYLQAGAVSNDATHITNPSPKGIGSTAVLRSVLEGVSTNELGLINVHGTATMYNDQMESKAIENTGLSDVPANALKGYYGHTMGAAGILETILSLRSLDDGQIIGTRGFKELGVSGRMNISADACKTDKRSVVKLISGFGGCNAAVLYDQKKRSTNICMPSIHATHHIHVTSDKVVLDGTQVATEGQGMPMLTYIYKEYVGDYPRFYKMDILGKLGFVASEMLLQKEGTEGRYVEREDRSVVLFNHSSSISADTEFQKGIASAEEFFPSPSVFVYTLPNIVTGEIAIRNKYQGETSFYILPCKDREQMDLIIQASFLQSGTGSMIAGWINADDANNFEAEISIIERT